MIIALVLPCILLNAVLALIEMAFVSLSKPELRQMVRLGNRQAQRLLELREHPERTLSVLQIGITLVGAISAAAGGVGAETYLTPYVIDLLGTSPLLGEIIAITGVILPLTFINVILGELVPKTLAIRNPISISLFAMRFLIAMDEALSPVVTLLEKTTNRVLKFFPAIKTPPATTEETAAPTVLSKEHHQYVANIVGLEKKSIRDIFVPWAKVDTVDVSFPADQVSSRVYSSGHTRLPVTSGDELIGVLHTKEFMAYVSLKGQDWPSIVRPILRVHETDTLVRALKMMQERRSHLSIVADSNGNILGIVTIEDIIEEIVGDISDEDDDHNVRKLMAMAARKKWL